MAVEIGLFGKHPGYGDFVRVVLSDVAVEGLTNWMDTSLHEMREHLGNRWGGFWDNAQDLRFWIGHEVFGHSLCGVLRASEDRVGRRYPLVLAVEQSDIAPPVVDADQSLYDALEHHFAEMQPGKDAAALLEGLDQSGLDIGPESPTAKAEGSRLWAHHPEDDLTALLTATATEDANRARLARSYWWSAPQKGRHPLWLGQAGLPDAPSLAWLLNGIRAEDPVAPPPDLEKKEKLDVQQ